MMIPRRATRKISSKPQDISTVILPTYGMIHAQVYFGWNARSNMLEVIIDIVIFT
jgi:hypothetical protein